MSTLRNWCLLGIPDHQGVIHVGGRIGSVGGPDAFRKAFARFSGRDGVAESLIDLGNVGPISQDIEQNQQLGISMLAGGHQKCGISVFVGGGHDHGYTHLAGISHALGGGKKIGCINIDAHLDVRKPSPLITSGSPFFLALESSVILPENFIEFGIQPQCNSPELWDYVKARGLKVVPIEDLRHGEARAFFEAQLRDLESRCDAIVISFDLDAVEGAHAPGVSAPQSEGFSPGEAFEILEVAGRSKKVVSLGIFELNPAHDIDGRTAKLAATAAYRFIMHSLRR